jgi:hypothetical protein
MVMAITIGANVGKEARILIKCTLLHPEDKTTIL